MQKNEVISLDIEGMTSEGQGVGRVDGMAVFVPGALPDERVQAHIIKVQKRYAIAKCLEIVEKSPARVVPRCPVFGRCGGCQLQHMDYAAQLRYKRQQVIDALERLGGFRDDVGSRIAKCMGMAHPWEYRNKASIPCANGTEGIELGFYAQRSHRIVAVEDCPLQEVRLSSVLAAVKNWAQEHALRAYDETTKRGLLRHVFLRNAPNGDCMAVIVTTGDLPHADTLQKNLSDALPGLVSLIHNRNTREDNVILGTEYYTVWGKERLDVALDGLSFAVSAASFMQVNTSQSERLYRTALDMLEWRGDERVIDAYCGMGTLTEFAARRCAQATGVESIPQAVEDAQKNAERNGISNADFICAEAERELPRRVESGEKIDALLLDPPRKGCDPALLEAAIASNTPRILYISCNPATQARDAKALAEGGYDLIAGQPVDMFPQTAHVENILRFEKRSK